MQRNPTMCAQSPRGVPGRGARGVSRIHTFVCPLATCRAWRLAIRCSSVLSLIVGSAAQTARATSDLAVVRACRPCCGCNVQCRLAVQRPAVPADDERCARGSRWMLAAVCLRPCASELRALAPAKKLEARPSPTTEPRQPAPADPACRPGPPAV